MSIISSTGSNTDKSTAKTTPWKVVGPWAG